MNSTIGSTAETDRLVALLPEPHRALVIDCLNARSKRKAHAKKMTTDRSAAIEAGIVKAIEHYLDTKLRNAPHCKRTGYLMERFEAGKWQLFGLKQIPDDETVRRVVDNYFADF